MAGSGPRAVVLGGGGGIGSVAVRALATLDDFAEIVVADARVGAAAAVCADVGDARCRPVEVDATSPSSLRGVIEGAGVVVGCIGPFYRFGPAMLAAAIDAGVPYVDVCDDLDATEAMLAMDAGARAAGVTALVGMGNSPGLANVFVKLCAEDFLDEVHAVDIMHIHGGEPEEGAAVLAHRIHAMRSDVPLYVDGEMRTVRMLEPSGQAFVRETEFRDVGTSPVFPYPHPETITLPQHVPGLRRATNLGAVFPLAYFERTMELVREGLDTDRIIATLQEERPRLLADAGVHGPGGCLKVEVSGVHAGAPHTYVLSLSSSERGAGEGTGIPAALGAALVQRGRIARPGVVPPEACVPVHEMLALAGAVVPHFGMGTGLPLHLEHVAPDGTRTEVPLAFG